MWSRALGERPEQGINSSPGPPGLVAKEKYRTFHQHGAFCSFVLKDKQYVLSVVLFCFVLLMSVCVVNIRSLLKLQRLQT